MMIPYKGSCANDENNTRGKNKFIKECKSRTHTRASSALAGKTVNI